MEKNGCCGILPSQTKSTISQKIQPWRKMVVVEFFHHGQNPRSLKSSALEKSIMDKIHDHSKNPTLEKNGCCGILPSWTKSMTTQNFQSWRKWLSRNSSIMDKIQDHSEKYCLGENGCRKILPLQTKSMTTQKILPWRKMVAAEFFHHGQNP